MEQRTVDPSAAAPASPSGVIEARPPKPKKEASIETLRGLAIVLMVAGHVIGDSRSAGLRVADDSWWRYGYYAFEYVRMPLFTAISGFVYALRPVSAGRTPGFLSGKARRILIPMVTVGTLQYLLRVVTPDVNNPVELGGIWRIYLFPFDQFWFLQSVFLVFCAVALLDTNQLLSSSRRWLAWLAVAFAALLFFPRFTTFFSFHNFLWLLPYFLLGVGANRFARQVFTTPVVAVLGAVFLVGFAAQQVFWFDRGGLRGLEESLLSAAVGASGILLLFHFRRTVPALAWLGAYAFGIYLLHVPGTAGARIVLGRLTGGAVPTPLLFVVCLLAGLALPIVLERWIMRSPRAALFFFGLSPKPVKPALTASPAPAGAGVSAGTGAGPRSR